MTSFHDKSQSNPHLAVTIGDPAGIGIEIILKALSDPSITQNGKLSIIGTRSLIQQTYQGLSKQGNGLANPNTLDILDVPLDPTIQSQITTGVGNAASGQASFTYLQTAIDRTLQGEFQGIVTAPIAKSCWKMAGHHYPGQTEILAQKSNVEKFGMLFVGRSPYTGWTLRTLLVTTHIPLNQVSTLLTPQLMSLKLELLIDCLVKEFGIKSPKIVIAGLNPHSGENGQLGTEEEDWLSAWLEQAKKQYSHVDLVGLVPPDTMWVKPAQAWYGNLPSLLATGDPSRDQATLSDKNPADAYLALYHDQGLIPVKLMAFDQAINTTIGLPFVRTSPDHGTAFDIAGKGIARSTSMESAIQLGFELTRQRLIH